MIISDTAVFMKVPTFIINKVMLFCSIVISLYSIRIKQNYKNKFDFFLFYFTGMYSVRVLNVN